MKVELLKEHEVLVDESLEFWGDMDSYNENLKEFKDSLEEKLNNLNYYKNNNDWNNYGILSHSIKSECKYFGFMKEAEVFLEHELKGKEGNGEFINENFNNLQNTITSIQDLLNQYFEGPTSNTILVADDSSIILNFIEKNISNKYKIIKANNGKEAVDTIANNSLYAILLDLNMPSSDGFEVLEYLKTNDL